MSRHEHVDDAVGADPIVEVPIPTRHDHPVTAVPANRWWQAMDTRIGIVPVPLLLVIIGLVALFIRSGTVPSDILLNIAVLSAGGFLCAELGKRTPVLRHIG